MDKRLKKLFNFYNREYFDCKLRISDIRWGKSLGLAETTYLEPAFPIITLTHPLKKLNRILRIVLLHEMVHVSGIHDHGPKFIKRIHRLVKQGVYDNLL